MGKIFFLIGSSGSGKTTAAKVIEAMRLPHLVVCYSDSLPVPTPEEMIKVHGSQEEWQRLNTIMWVGKMKEEFLADNDILFDMQTRPAFIEEACQANNIASYETILFDCSDEERKKRLIARGQPGLAHADMMNWAKYLRERSKGPHHTIIDNTYITPEEGRKRLLSIMGR